MSESINKPTLAVALIVKNEAANLDACLKTVEGWVDEIVILDSGSSDETEAVARRYTDKFFVNTEWPGFGPQRRLAQQYVESDYVLWLDADERVTPELKASIQQALRTAQQHSVFKLVRLNYFLGKAIRHCGWYPEYVVRMHHTQFTTYNDNLVHEKIVIPQTATLASLKGDLIHYPYKNIKHYLAKSSSYGEIWSEEKALKGKRSSVGKALTHALSAFIKMYVVKRGFLDGKEGLILSLLSSYSVMVKYLYLFERQRSSARE
ncbi:glycosyltransferase family 2 protein [Vibrio vulnificus]|uniref:glycosyltransferase family 2 protein n=1 Tax=Vibrio vulnificus TaxID=672 RepID=UPI003EDB1B09